MRRSAVLAVAVLAALAACKKSEPRRTEGGAVTADRGTGTGSDPWKSTAPPPSAKPVIERPFFFSATKEGKTLYLLGTMHLGVDAERQLPPWVFAKLDASPAFAMEADVSSPSTIALLNRTDGKTLSEELGPDHWKKLQDAIGPALADGMNRMKPFATLTALAMKDIPMTAPMDAVLLKRARDAGKPITYLETVEAQLAAVEPYATAADVRAMLDHPDHARTSSKALSDAYVAGDTDAMLRLFDDRTLWIASGRDPARYTDFIDATLTHRNASWIPPLERLAASGGAFVAVGAGHLVGPSNVPDMLAARGFTITRLTGP